MSKETEWNKQFNIGVDSIDNAHRNSSERPFIRKFSITVYYLIPDTVILLFVSIQNEQSVIQNCIQKAENIEFPAFHDLKNSQCLA